MPPVSITTGESLNGRKHELLSKADIDANFQKSEEGAISEKLGRWLVVLLGLLDFNFYIPSSCPAPQPILPKFQLPKQNEAGSGMTKINVHLPNPVYVCFPPPPSLL